MYMFESIAWLNKVICKEHASLLVVTCLHIFTELTGVIYAVLFRYILDFAASGSVTMIRYYAAVFSIILLFQNISNALYRLIKEKILINIGNSLKRKLSDSFLHGNFSYVSNIHSGEWMNRFSNDVNVVAGNAVNLIPNTLGILFHLLASIIVLHRMVSGFIGLLLTVIILAVAIELFFFKRIKILHKEVQEKDGQLRIFIQECLNSLSIIKAYVKEDKMLLDENAYLDAYKDSRIRKNNFYVTVNFFFGTGVNGLLLLSSIYCAYQILVGKITYGTFVAVIEIVSQMRSPLANAYTSIPSFYTMLGSIERLKAVEENRENIINDCSLKDFDCLRFDHVFFSYKDRNSKEHVIDDLCFEFDKGEFVGVSGPSGCGKSTLFNLLLALHKPLAGSITITNNGKRYILDERFRELFAYVPQGNRLMKGTIRNIICFGEEYIDDKMHKALVLACCDEFVSALENGIDTELKESGSGLSEGQMQRIAIARALYSDRPILLLDEVTSSLNEELEIKILENLKNLTDKTVFLITHRKKALQFVDARIECKEIEGYYRWSVK